VDTFRYRAIRALDLLLPPRCYGCGEEVQKQGTLCAACWSRLRFISNPRCRLCGYPFDYALPDSSLCGRCLSHPPSYDRAVSALVYDEASRKLILSFKHGDKTETAPSLAQLMAQAGHDCLAESDLIVPVPLHRGRLFSRRYNQSALLARVLASISNLPWSPYLLERGKRTVSQGGLDRGERARNVGDAFRVRSGKRAALSGQHVLLVDDVLTTGATVEACTACLRQADVASVQVLTLARVVTPGQATI
jgi:ComF family protein